MPIYVYECGCGYKTEEYQPIGADAPVCICGGVMSIKPSPIAILNLKNDGGYIHRSKSYKDGYKKEYLKSTNREAWKGTIIEPQA